MIDAVVSGEAHATGYAHAGGGDAPVRIFYRLFGAPGARPVLIVHGLSFFHGTGSALQRDWDNPDGFHRAARQFLDGGGGDTA